MSNQNPYGPGEPDGASDNTSDGAASPTSDATSTPSSAGGYPTGGFPPPGNYPPSVGGYPPAAGGFPSAAYPLVSPYPGVGARFGALVLDYLLMLVVSGIIGATFMWGDVADWFDALDRWDGTGSAPELNMAGFYIVGVLSVVLWFVYRIGMECTRGQTLGKMAVKIKVVDVDGNLPTFGASFTRNSWFLIVQVLGLIPLVGWIATIGIPIALAVSIGNSRYRQSFTDVWAKTYVISTR